MKNILQVIYDNFHTLFNSPLPMQNFRGNQYIHKGLYILSYLINAFRQLPSKLVSIKFLSNYLKQVNIFYMMSVLKYTFMQTCI